MTSLLAELIDWSAIQIVATAMASNAHKNSRLKDAPQQLQCLSFTPKDTGHNPNKQSSDQHS